MTISIRFTYDAWDQESLEIGDFNRAGFCDRNGSIISENSETNPRDVPDEDIEQWQEPGDLYYCIDSAIDLGINQDVGNWFNTSDSTIEDYSTCEEFTYSMHIKGLTPDQYKRIGQILAKGRISDQDEEYLNSIDGQLPLG